MQATLKEKLRWSGQSTKKASVAATAERAPAGIHTSKAQPVLLPLKTPVLLLALRWCVHADLDDTAGGGGAAGQQQEAQAASNGQGDDDTVQPRDQGTQKQKEEEEAEARRRKEEEATFFVRWVGGAGHSFGDRGACRLAIFGGRG